MMLVLPILALAIVAGELCLIGVASVMACQGSDISRLLDDTPSGYDYLRRELSAPPSGS